MIAMTAGLSINVDRAIVDPYTYADEGRYHELFTMLRREDPVHWTEPVDHRPFWTVTRHADIAAVEIDAARFINQPRTVLVTVGDEEMIKAFTGGNPHIIEALVNMDGGRHRSFRAMTQAWFGPKRVAVLEKEIRALARESVDHLLALGGRCDFVEEVALWYPLRVIMRLLGVPRSDEQLMMKLTQEAFGQADPEQQRSTDASGVIALLIECTAYFEAITQDRRANPKDDVATVIAHAEVDGKPISLSDTTGYYMIIATAGHDTTSSSISAGLLQFIRHPEALAQLRENPALLPTAVDEFIRWSTPVKHFFRTATQDSILHGREIRAGDSLMMCYPSANRDEEVYPDPFAFRIDRKPARHLAFGYGPHVCLGQHLAKLEIRIFFEELLARVDNFALDGDPKLTIASFVSGLKHLPIRYAPR